MMAISATVINVDLELSDVDRGVYESLRLKLAQHPSESAVYLVTRVIAYALEFEEGIAFTQGLCDGDSPPIWVRDLTGQLTGWIDVGQPDGARLHKATKAAPRVAVYCHKHATAWLSGLAGAKIYDRERVQLYLLDRQLIERLAEDLGRRNQWALSRMEGVLYIETAHGIHELEVTPTPWPRR